MAAAGSQSNSEEGPKLDDDCKKDELSSEPATEDGHTNNNNGSATKRKLSTELLASNVKVESLENIENLPQPEEDEVNVKRGRLSEANSKQTEEDDKDLLKKRVKVEPVESPSNVISTSEAESSQAATNSSLSNIGVLNPLNVKTAVKVEKADATSTTRPSCRYGIRCYRRNPMHRVEEAHPGDHDYRRPDYPPPPDGTPDCPYGDSCYRRNPTHFEQYSHPPNTDFAKNYKIYQLRKRRQRRQRDIDDSFSSGSELDDYDLNDPFIDDQASDSDYIPSDDDDEY